MNGLAALAIVAGISSCTKDVTAMSPVDEAQKAKENAELQLGFVIPDGQTWDMASQVEASVTVNGDFGAKYTVSIYENNPFQNNNRATVLGKAEVTSGSTVNISFTCPDAATMVFAAIKDEKGYSYVKPANVKNGKVEVVFGENAAGSRAMRTATNSHVDIPTCTVTNAYVQSFLEGAKEPTDANVADNYDNSYVANCQWYANGNGKLSKLLNNYDWCTYDGISQAEKDWYTANVKALIDACNKDWNSNSTTAYTILMKLKEYTGDYNYWELTVNSEGGLVPDETYVTKFKITGEWNKLIGVLPTEEANGDARTVYVSGKWTIPAGKEQRVGGGAVIVIVEGGEIVIPEESELNFVNQARLVNAGGTISGAGTINVTNGNNPGEEGYNSGTISIGKFNQNFGTFFNYGTFANYATELNGGAGTSTFVNRGHMYISGAPKGSSSANMQIKNACWFEASGEVACKLIENGSGSYFKAAALDLSCSEGGEGIGTYIAADENSSMVITGAVKLNSTLIYGPNGDNSSYLEFDNINFINVGERYPVTGNLNIYVGSFTGANVEGFKEAWNLNMAAGSGAKMVGKAAFNTAPTDPSDCSPGFTPNIPEIIWEDLKVYTYAFEDQTVGSDYDMNDVVLKVSYKVKSTNAETGEVEYDKTKLNVTLVAAGATYNIKVKIGETYLFGGTEIHDKFGVSKGVMVNTGNGKAQTASPQSDEVPVPDGLADEDGNIDFNELPVTIEVLSTDKTYVFPNTDLYPHAVMVPTDWAWPTERTNVREAYAGTDDANKVTIEGTEFPENSFTVWGGTAAESRNATMNGWFNHPVTGKVMTNTNNNNSNN